MLFPVVKLVVPTTVAVIGTSVFDDDTFPLCLLTNVSVVAVLGFVVTLHVSTFYGLCGQSDL